MTASYNELLNYDNDYNLTGTILTIATDDEPCLKQLASSIPIDEIKSIEIQQLIIDMIETMKAAPGIGLAAPQIYQSLRIMVFYLPVARDDINCRGVPLTVLINPIIEPLDDQVTYDFEGCLSSGLNHRGEKIDQIAEGWHARLVQHEFDHLNGILYPTLMAEEDKLLTVDEWKQITTTTVKV